MKEVDGVLTPSHPISAITRLREFSPTFWKCLSALIKDKNFISPPPCIVEGKYPTIWENETNLHSELLQWPKIWVSRRTPFNILVNGRYCFESFPPPGYSITANSKFEREFWLFFFTLNVKLRIYMDLLTFLPHIHNPCWRRPPDRTTCRTWSKRPSFPPKSHQSAVFFGCTPVHRPASILQWKMKEKGGGEIIPSQIEFFSENFWSKSSNFYKIKVKSGQKTKKNDQNWSFQWWPRKRRKTNIPQTT